MGLATFTDIVEPDHGSIEVTSTLDVGSEFAFMLPLAHVDTVSNAANSSQFLGQSAGGHLVLVVDDNKDAADSLAELVRLFGHEVHVACDGATAVELARSCPPELVLCDIGLPGMDGYQVARGLLAELHDKPMLVAVTGYSQPDEVAVPRGRIRRPPREACRSQSDGSAHRGVVVAPFQRGVARVR